MAMAGTNAAPDGGTIPNITPDTETGIGTWPDADIALLLKSGITPDGDVVGAQMGEVVEHSTSRLTDQDVRAIVAYLKSLPPIENKITRSP